jgi:hypothetical protein
MPYGQNIDLWVRPLMPPLLWYGSTSITTPGREETPDARHSGSFNFVNHTRTQSCWKFSGTQLPFARSSKPRVSPILMTY